MKSHSRIPSSKVETSNKVKEEKETKKEEKPTIQDSVSIPASTPSASIFSDANKVNFSKIQNPMTPIIASPETKIEKKKRINKHAQDDLTVFVGNLPSSSI